MVKPTIAGTASCFLKLLGKHDNMKNSLILQAKRTLSGTKPLQFKYLQKMQRNYQQSYQPWKKYWQKQK